MTFLAQQVPTPATTTALPKIPRDPAIEAILRAEPSAWFDASPDFLALAGSTLEWGDACNDKSIFSTGPTPPAAGAGIGGQPTLEFVATSGLVVRPLDPEDARLDHNEWSMFIIITPAATGGSVVTGRVLGSGATGADRQPTFIFSGAGQQTFRMTYGDLTPRIQDTVDLTNTAVAYLVSGSVVAGHQIFRNGVLAVDASADKLPLTDGRWQIGGVASGVSSINLRGSLARIVTFNKALGRDVWSGYRAALFAEASARYGIPLEG